MQSILIIVKWLLWVPALGTFGLVLLLTLIGKGVSDFSDILMVAVWCGLLAFPGLLAHIVEKSVAK
jgi:hypothetical protein